jgi:hypothetical protein
MGVKIKRSVPEVPGKSRTIQTFKPRNDDVDQLTALLWTPTPALHSPCPSPSFPSPQSNFSLICYMLIWTKLALPCLDSSYHIIVPDYLPNFASILVSNFIKFYTGLLTPATGILDPSCEIAVHRINSLITSRNC